MGQKTGLKKAVRIGVFLVFMLFYLYLLLQYFKVFIYYDDYGYLSLSYGYLAEDVVGSDYNFFQALNYIGHHYFYTSGRLWCLFLYQILYMIGGLRLVQAFMATVVLAVTVLSYRLVMYHLQTIPGKENIFEAGPLILAVFLSFLYGFIGILIHRSATYWFAAAFLYIVPAVTLICFIKIYYETAISEKSRRWWIGCIILAFLTAFSQEQWLVAVITAILGIYGYKYYIFRKEKNGFSWEWLKVWDVGVLAAAIAGALPILTSPAVKERMGRNMEFLERSFLERVFYNIKAVTRLFFEPSNQKYIFLFLLLLLLMTLVMLKKKQAKYPVPILFLVATAAVGCYLFTEVHIFYHGEASQYSDMAVWLLFVYILWMSAQIVYFLFINNNILQGLIYTSGFFSMACLVVVPELPPRVLMPYILLSFSLMGYIFWEAFMEGKRLWIAGGALMLCVVAAGSTNMRNIYRGYHANWKVHQYNDAKIRESVQKIHQGEEITEIHLYCLLDSLCANEMVYNPNFSFMIYWMDQYYDLPENVELIYDVVTDMEDLTVH